jgi:hypothetical protein
MITAWRQEYGGKEWSDIYNLSTKCAAIRLKLKINQTLVVALPMILLDFDVALGKSW